MDSPLSLTIVGLAVIVVTVGILMRGRSSPIIAMSVVPVILSLIHI